MILLDSDRLENIRNVSRIRAVISAGRLFEREQLNRLLSTAERMAQSA